MARVLAIIGLVGVFIATGVAGAAPADNVRLPVSVTRSDDTTPEPDSVEVVRGDHLWKISARHLGRDAPNSVIAPYWRQVIEVNTPHLLSGDPNLIFPGEIVELPASREQP